MLWLPNADPFEIALPLTSQETRHHRQAARLMAYYCGGEYGMVIVF